MLTDRYGLALSTASAAARDAYVEASDLALTFYPGAAETYDRAIAADPNFALAHVGDTMVLSDPATFGSLLERAGFVGVKVECGRRAFRFLARSPD